MEFSGRAGILGMEYLSASSLSEAKYESFLQSDILRREYLNQSFNFLPILKVLHSSVQSVPGSKFYFRRNIKLSSRRRTLLEFRISSGRERKPMTV